MPTSDLVRIVKVKKIVQESSNIKTMYFRDHKSSAAHSGQFVMVWLPGVGEFPMSLSLHSKTGDLASISVKAMGECSKKLYDSKLGEKIGIRGPYGNSFRISNSIKRALLVGGGTGMAPMIRLAEELARRPVRTSIVIGAKTKSEIPFLTESRSILGNRNVYASTNDGTFGFKGLATEQAKALLEQVKFDVIYSCGPEKMMTSLFELAKISNTLIQFSMERIMKCGMGICGSCTIGDIVLCKDGPILNSAQLSKLGNELGKLHRDKTGTLVPI